MNEKNRLLALLYRFREQSWAAAAIDALRLPLCISSATSGDNATNPQRDHFLKIYLRRRDHLARLGVAATGLDQFLVGLSTLPADARITGSSFSGGGFAVKAFYGPHGELIGCITLQQRQRDVPPNLGISPRKPITYPFMLDVAWIASDAHGQVGIFTTGGRGPVPVVSVRSNLAEELEERLDKLPIVSEFKLWIELKRPDDFVGFARRGMYAFDWQDVHRTVVRETCKYEIVASPLVPIAVTDLPDDIAELARQTKLSDVSLANDKQIDVQDLIDCLTPNAR